MQEGDELVCYVLEANAGPDFGQSGSGEGENLIRNLIENVARMTVDCSIASMMKEGRSEKGLNLARSVEDGVQNGYIVLDDGKGEWEERKGRFRQCYHRVITQTTNMKYY